MDWFNFYGLIIMAIIMVPNIIFAARCKDGFENLWQNKAVEALEQAGRFACMGLMIFNIPGTYAGFWFEGGLAAYLAVNGVLVGLYCAIWAACFRKDSLFRALSLSVLPSLVFLFSGAVLLSFPLMGAAMIFAPCHIAISVKNFRLRIKNKSEKGSSAFDGARFSITEKPRSFST